MMKLKKGPKTVITLEFEVDMFVKLFQLVTSISVNEAKRLSGRDLGNLTNEFYESGEKVMNELGFERGKDY